MLKLDQIAKLAALGAFGAIGGMVLAFGGLVLLTAPGRTGGMDPTGAAVTWIAVGGVVIALIAVHLVIARQLVRLSQGLDKKHPL